MKNTIVNSLIRVLDELEIDCAMSKREFIKVHWYEYNHYTKRCFDVALFKARKSIANKQFIGKFNNEVKRLS